MAERTLNQSIIKIRVDLQNAKLKKTGKNKYANFDYFELADFLPKLNELMLSENINDIFTIEDGNAKLILKKIDEENVYKIPFVIFDTPLTKDGKASMQDIQYLGALNTYYKRYLYLNAFGITDGEIIDSMNNAEIEKSKMKKTTTKKVIKEPIKQSNEEQKKEIHKLNYKMLLLERLDQLGINKANFIKEHKLGAETTQEEAFILLDQLEARYEEIKNADES